MSPRDPRTWHLAVWLAVCSVLAGTLGGLLSRRLAPDADLALLVFWVLAWGAVGVAGGLALRATRRS